MAPRLLVTAALVTEPSRALSGRMFEHRAPLYGSRAYSARASLRTGIPESAFFQSVKRSLRSRQLQRRQRVHGIDEHAAAMIENPLELANGFGGLTCGGSPSLSC